MTHDNSSTPTASDAEGVSTSKPARRRATRTVAPPRGSALPAGDVPADTAEQASTPDLRPEITPDPGSNEQRGDAAAPKRAPRRATRRAPGAATAPGDEATPTKTVRKRAPRKAPAAAPDPAAAPTPVLDVLSEFQIAGSVAPIEIPPAATLQRAELDKVELPSAGSAAAPRRRAARRSTAAPVDSPAADAAPPLEPQSPAPAEVKPKVSAEPQRRASGRTEKAAPAPVSRLATTALLFQAPDLTVAPRVSRRDPIPAAPSVSEPDVPGDPVVGQQDPVPSTPRRRTSRRAERVAVTESAADVVEQSPEAIALTKDDLAAIAEIEAIESELIAEGKGAEADLSDCADSGEDAESLDSSAEDEEDGQRRRRRRGGRGRRVKADTSEEPVVSAEIEPAVVEPETDLASEDAGPDAEEEDEDEGTGSSRRRRRRRRSGSERIDTETVRRTRTPSDEVTALKGSTRLEAKRQRRREGRDAGRRRQIITEAEFLARREAVERSMVVREREGRTQIAVLEDGILVEHYVSAQSQMSMAGNVYLGRVQNVLPSMEAAFIDIGRGRNAVLYAGEVNWDASGVDGQPRRIEQALKSGDSVLVQVTKDPIGHKGARLTSQVTLAGRYLVLVPGGGMTGISRKLPDTERARLKKILRDVVPEGSGVIVRTAAEGAREEELRADVERLQAQWSEIQTKAKSASAPALLQGEADLAIRVVRDIFNDDFSALVVQGDSAWAEISTYVDALAPDLRERVSRWTSELDLFSVHRVDEQLAKGMDRKVWLPSGGSLVIDRTEAMTVVDVNTGKFTGAGGTLEETVTRNNLEAAEEIVRQLRLRDIGGIIVIDFIDMVLESNRDLVLRRLVECLGRDRTKHQVAEVTSLGLVQMTRKRVGQGLVEAFSETCEHCLGRGFIVQNEPVERHSAAETPVVEENEGARAKSRRKRVKDTAVVLPAPAAPVLPDASSQAREAVKATLATIAAAAAHAHDHREDGPEVVVDVQRERTEPPARDQIDEGGAGDQPPRDLPPAAVVTVVDEPAPTKPVRRRATRAGTTAASGTTVAQPQDDPPTKGAGATTTRTRRAKAPKTVVEQDSAPVKEQAAGLDEI